MACTGFLRFLTCGSVDDGKSTLIGRMLYDAGLVYADQLAGLVKNGGEPDCSLLLDGLLAEREQGITIDVAYRHFATPMRRFMVADSPGHEEYTPNMVTAASHAEVAVLLADASRGLQIQTRRHAAICRLMGIGTVLLAVNKMDLVDYREDAFRDIESRFKAMSAELGIPQVSCMPVCARDGGNVVRLSEKMPWYQGPALLEWLEHVEPVQTGETLPFRMAVQWVNRPDSTFRGVSGTVAAGRIRRGDRVRVLESGVVTTIAGILTPDGDVEQAETGTPVTLTFSDEIDAGRGSLIVAEEEPSSVPQQADLIEAELVWLGKEPLQPGRSYLFRRGPVERQASVSSVCGRLNLYSFKEEPAQTIGVNEQGRIVLEVIPPLAFEPYEKNQELGHGILVDRVSGATVGALLLRRSAMTGQNVVWHNFSVTHADRARLMGQTPCVLWFTGLSGSGKTTIADLVERRLFSTGRHTFVLDGDNMRHGLNRDLGFSAADRVENIRRAAEVAKLMMKSGLIVMVTFISPFIADRRMARALFPKGSFFEIFVDTPLDVCMKRDVKGLYARALTGEIKEMTGLSSPYEKPEHPDLVLDGTRETPEKLADRVLELIAPLLNAPVQESRDGTHNQS